MPLTVLKDFMPPSRIGASDFNRAEESSSDHTNELVDAEIAKRNAALRAGEHLTC